MVMTTVEDRAFQIDSQIVAAFKLLLAKDEKQRNPALWSHG